MTIKINKEQAAYINGLETREAKKDFIMEHILLSLEESLDRENTEHISFKDREFHTSDANLALYLLHFPHLFKPKDSGREKFDKFIEDNGLKKFTPPEQKENSLKFDLPTDKMFWNIQNSKDDLRDRLIEHYKEDDLSSFLNKTSITKEQLKDTTKPIDELIDSAADNFLNDFNAKLKKVVLDDGTECYYSEWKLLEDPNPVKDPIFYGYLSKEGVNHIATKKYTKEDMEKCFNESRRYRIEPPNPRDKFWRYFEEYLNVNHK